ncbi:MAG: SURF1 family protein [Comamonadaceae bacterium]|nr:MAG: SURF1 family protein [Comamonadaceae bacterium]
MTSDRPVVQAAAQWRSARFWIVTLAAAAMIALTFSLGQWQLRRAAQKQGLQQAIETQGRLAVLDNAALTGAQGLPNLVQRRAELRGSWLGARTVFLDNRPMGGKTGFIVVTPLQLENSPVVVLVQRGWAPRDFTARTHLPEVVTPAGLVSVEGRIAPSPSKTYQLGEPGTGAIRQNLDIADFRRETGLSLLDVSLLQTGAASEGLLREWAAPDFGIDKHYGYAFQWFGLCALLVGLYAWFQIISPLRKRSVPR